jgi:CD109 antigen
MLNFVPNIVVMDYLTTLNKLTPEIESKAKKYLESGYQRELTYKHDDGSYSAFGKSDKSGSTWLTAFVAKSFSQAAKYILVDEEIITQALDFLVNIQLQDGSFPEVGHVSHKAMQGGTSEGIALTAYTLITFLENQNLAGKYEKPIEKALDFIVRRSESITDDYSLAVLSFALHLSDRDEAKIVLKKLDLSSIKGNGMMHWKAESLTVINQNSWEIQPDSLDIELTSYALLSYIKAGRDEESLAIMKWLISKRNSNGGFVSTQDTVVGLQALSNLAKKIIVTKNDITMKLKDDQGKETEIVLNELNALILQKFQLSSNVQKIEVKAKGRGFSILQISYKYNINDAVSSPRFLLDPKVVTSDKNSMVLSVCVNFLPDKSVDKSNMAVMEVEFPSGFAFDTDSLPALQTTTKVKVS